MVKKKTDLLRFIGFRGEQLNEFTFDYGIFGVNLDRYYLMTSFDFSS